MRNLLTISRKRGWVNEFSPTRGISLFFDSFSSASPISVRHIRCNPAHQQFQKPLFVRFKAHLDVRRPLHRPRKPFVINFQSNRSRRAQIGPNGIGHSHRVKQRRRQRMIRIPAHPLVVEQRQLVGQRRPMRKNRLPLLVSSRICVESSGIMKTGTPTASSALNPAGSQRIFHSADGGCARPDLRRRTPDRRSRP